MLLDKFEIGRNYRFSKEMWLKDMSGLFTEKVVDEMSKGWVSEIDGLKVTFDSDFDGYVRDYLISPEWCEEVIVIEPLKTRDDIKDMYKQVLYLEDLEETLEELEERLDFMGRSNFIKYINSEIERVIDELGLEE